MSRTSFAKRIVEPTATQLVEESVHLLRQVSAGTLAIYFFGAGAWAFGLLYFWADTTWFAPSSARLAWYAIALVLLYGLLNVAQAEFCARLLAARSGLVPERFTVRRAARLFYRQMISQSHGAALIPFAALLMMIFPWVYSFYQNLSVLGVPTKNESLSAEAWRQARVWQRQMVVGQLYFTLFGLVVWLNVASAFYALPWMANRWLGVENLFGFNGLWLFNTTFLMSVTVISWLAIDPLVKAFYVLRVFYGRSQITGADLRVDLTSAGKLRKAGTGALAAALCLGFFLTPPPAHAAAEKAPATTTSASTPLDQAIDEVLRERDFQWRLRPDPSRKNQEEDNFGDQGWSMIREMKDTLKRWKDKFDKWLDDLFPDREAPVREEVRKSDSGSGLAGMMKFLTYLLALVGLGGLVWIIVQALQHQSTNRPLLTATGVAVAPIDLRDESVQAAQMPADGWLALAREQMQKGEWRLALRALYLASLARMASEGLITLAKHKTNLDYEAELRRRAPARTDMIHWFSARRYSFEWVWYGRGEAAESDVRAWLTEMETSA